MGEVARQPFVTAGLLALPWTLPDPQKRRPGNWDCDSCRQGPGAHGGRSEGVRAFMHCGYMDRSQWPAGESDVPPFFGPFEYTADVCPGWLVRQPDVVEGARAWRAYEKGALQVYDPQGLNVIWECVEVADRAFSAFEAEQLRKLAKGGR